MEPMMLEKSKSYDSLVESSHLSAFILDVTLGILNYFKIISWGLKQTLSDENYH